MTTRKFTAPPSHRLEALREWRERAARAGHPVPSHTDLHTLAFDGWTDDVDAETCLPWRDTIEHILSRVEGGDQAAARFLPERLRSPRPTVRLGQAPQSGEPRQERPGRPSMASPTQEMMVGILQEWRKRGQDRGEALFRGLRDSQLRQIVRSHDRSAEAIARLLPQSKSRLAPEIARILGEYMEGTSRRPDPVPAQASSSPGASAGAGRPTPSPTPTPTPTAPAPSPAPASETASTGARSPRPRASDRPSAARSASPEAASPAEAASAGESAPRPQGASPADTPSPSVRPSPSPRPAPAQSPSDPSLPGPDEFVAYDFSPSPGGPPSGQLRASVRAEQASLTWKPYVTDQAVVLYRVVSSDEFEPYAPEKGTPVTGPTTSLRATDVRPFTSAVRFYQVWANAGSDPQDAAEQQPVLHARQAVVSPVHHLALREDSGRVIGQWSAFPGTTRVHVYRIPIERAATAGLDPAYRILPSEPNLGGFVDGEAKRGRRYLYQVAAEALVDDAVVLSAPVSEDVLVSTVLEQVQDLRLETRDTPDHPAFDLTWTTPHGGRVVVYRTRIPPRAGAAAAPLAEAALEQAALAPAERLAHPIGALEGGQSLMRDVPWPEGWHRAFFTPVTLLDGQARVGVTRTAARSAPVRDVRIVERVQQQVVTFAWPEGADAVQAYIGARHQDAAAAVGGRPVEVSKARYEQLGGLTFPSPLPRRGCSLHLVSVTFEGGSQIAGEPTSVDYPGLVELRYDVSLKRNLLGSPAAVGVTVTCAEQLPAYPPFVLVHNPDRLPLDVQDGRPLQVCREDDPSGQRTSRFTPPALGPDADGPVWKAEVKGLSGFLRLFADIDTDHLTRVALLDPDVSKLLLDSRPRFQR